MTAWKSPATSLVHIWYTEHLPIGLYAVPAPEHGAHNALEEPRHQLHLLVPLQVLTPDTAADTHLTLPYNLNYRHSVQRIPKKLFTSGRGPAGLWIRIKFNISEIQF